ncbi:MAG: Mur ligase domain-containing protein, partial [Candidatus Limnocylindrus sp.]
MSAYVRGSATLGALVTRLRERGLLVAGASEALVSSTETISASVQHDSRLLQPGGVFVAINGARLSGADFADEARARGAIAVLAESADAESIERKTEGRGGLVIRVTSAR